MNEMRIWSSLSHENILPFLGFCFYSSDGKDQHSDDAIFSLVSPWMNNGTVVEYAMRDPRVDPVKLVRDPSS